MRRPFLFALATLCALAGCRGKQRTMLVVEVDSNLAVPGEMDKVDVAVTANGKTQHMLYPLVGGYALPLYTVLVETTDIAGTLDIVAAGLLNSIPVVNEEAMVGFVEGQARLLKLFLAAECRSDQCTDPTKTCTTNRACVDKVRNPGDLPVFDPATIRKPADAGPVKIGDAAPAGDAAADARKSEAGSDAGGYAGVSGTGGAGGVGGTGTGGSAGRVDSGGAGGIASYGGVAAGGSSGTTAGGSGIGGGPVAGGTTSFGGMIGGGSATEGTRTGGGGAATGGTSGAGGSCPGTMCGSTCSDLTVDVNNCGACGRSCQGTNAQRLSCNAGLCDTTNCTADWGNCTTPLASMTDDGCETNLKTSVTNCGVCGYVCASGQRCFGGACVCDGTSCPSGCCNGQMCEAYASQTGLSCGTGGATCGACTAGRTCQSGQCACPSGLSWCGNVCANQQVFSGNCGGAPTALATGQVDPRGIVVDATSIYWTTYDGSTVMKVPIGGGIPTTLASGQTLSSLYGISNSVFYGIAVDDTNVYWTNCILTGTVAKVPTGGGSTTALALGQLIPLGIAVDATSVYWTTQGTTDSNGTVMKVPIGGGVPTTLAASQNNSAGIAIDATSVYWTTRDGGTVMKVPIGGGVPTTLASGQNTSAKIAVSATSVYWTNEGTSSNSYTDGTVMRVSIGGGAPSVLVAGQLNPYGVAVDATNVYWTNMNGGTVMKVPIGGGAPTVLTSLQNTPCDIAVDATSVYWTNYTYPGTVMKLTPK